MVIDSLTKRWIRDASDERAVRAGCWFDEARGQFVVDWLQDYLVLYEGECAGQPFLCHDWQYEATMRLFGWVHESDHWGRVVRRFRQAFVLVPKKNKKSPTLAAWGIYLLAGDGEPGQKVFLAAKDGKQAKEIAGKHAIEMVAAAQAAGRLSHRQYKLHRAEGRIVHGPTKSILLPLSSSNATTQKAKEGLNGCVLIDEVHVVDADFVRRVSRATLSRSEGLLIEVSTAGLSTDGYGFQRYEFAKKVAAGERDDIELMAMLHEAPQDLTDAALDADPLHFGKLANPAWGHTINPEEFAGDYRRSKDSVSALADFKTYRLNIWQRTANPWLRLDDWLRCGDDYRPEELAGRACGGGLDLSRTEDMTAFSLVFPEQQPAGDSTDRAYRLLTWYWLPEGAVKRHMHELPYGDWVRDGWLRMIPGEVMDYAALEVELADILGRFRLSALAYDKTYAHDLIGRLIDQHGLVDDTRYEFPQTIMAFTGPTTKFERLVIAGKMRHNRNPITTWQAGHVQVRRDVNDNVRPVKPPREDLKKVDGIVSAIMAVDAADRESGLSVYATDGVFYLGDGGGPEGAAQADDGYPPPDDDLPPDFYDD